MVSTLNSHPEDRGSIPLIYLNFFLFFLVILLRNYSLIIKKVQNSTQKLFVQFPYFKLFMYVFITYNKKKESKVLGHLLLITIIFWTVCPFDKEIDKSRGVELYLLIGMTKSCEMCPWGSLILSGIGPPVSSVFGGCMGFVWCVTACGVAIVLSWSTSPACVACLGTFVWWPVAEFI